MVDKEFTQICKEILGVSKKLEKIEPEELREIKASIERLSEAFNANKALFDESKSDFDGKYNKIAGIIKTFDTLKAQIEEVLKSGVIDDNAERLISTFSSKKIMDLLNEAKGVVDEKFSTIQKNGITPWSSTLEYPAGAVSVLNGKLYQAKTQNTNKNPSNNKETWHVIASEEWSENKFTQFSHFLSSNAQNGYTKLPNGLIIQWGVDTQVPQGDNTKMTFFPIVFPTACIALTLAHYGAGKEVSAMSYGTPSRTGAIFRHSWPHTPTAVAYIAIGY